MKVFVTQSLHFSSSHKHEKKKLRGQINGTLLLPKVTHEFLVAGQLIVTGRRERTLSGSGVPGEPAAAVVVLAPLEAISHGEFHGGGDCIIPADAEFVAGVRVAFAIA